MKNSKIKLAIRSALAAGLSGSVIVGSARAEVSPLDGYTASGAYQVHVEIVPYLWLPATSGTIKLGNGAAANISAGMPSISQLTAALTGAFLADGLVRYGPWSGELNIDYIAASVTRGLRPGVLGPRSLAIDATVTRVSPGIGYQVFNGPLGSLPTTLDARLGFSYFTSNLTLDLDRSRPFGNERISALTGSLNFAQPWIGLRAAFYPAPR